MSSRSESFEYYRPLSLIETPSLGEYQGTTPVMFRGKPTKTAQGVIIMLALLAQQACSPVGSPSPNIPPTQIPGVTQSADCPPPQLCPPTAKTETPQELNQINSQKLREFLGINPATTQAELAKIILARQQNTDWLFRKLSDGKVLASPGNTVNLVQFINIRGELISYGLDNQGESSLNLFYPPEGILVPQYPKIKYIEFNEQNKVGTVPMKTLTDGNNVISLYAPEEMLTELIKLWQPDDVKNFLRGYFGDPSSSVRKRLHLVFAPSDQGIQLGNTQTFYPTSDINYASVLSQDATSFEVVVNIPGVHSDSLLQGIPLNLDLAATLTNERLGFIAEGYPQQRPANNSLYFEAFSTIGEWEFLFDPEMRDMLMGGSDTYSNVLNPLANFLEQTVTLGSPLISP